TFMIVTHDQDEAMVVADRLAVMHDGRIVQSGPPREVYERPQTRFAAEFLGEANLFPDGAGFRLVRPERMTLSRRPAKGPRQGRVPEIAYFADRPRSPVQPDAKKPLPVSRPAGEPPLRLAVGDACWVTWPAEAEVKLPR